METDRQIIRESDSDLEEEHESEGDEKRADAAWFEPVAKTHLVITLRTRMMVMRRMMRMRRRMVIRMLLTMIRMTMTILMMLRM